MRTRSLKGAMLIELLVALVVAGILMVALTASISELMRLSTKSQNDSVGPQIAANVMERIRATPFDDLDNLSNNPIVINSGGNAPTVTPATSSDVLTRPAMIEASGATAKTWIGAINNLPVTSVPASAIVTVNPDNVGSDSRLVTITVKWNSYDQFATGLKHFSLSSFVYRYGVQRND